MNPILRSTPMSLKGGQDMEILRFDLTKKAGKFKKLNATNGGPICKRHSDEQYRSNFETYKEARIPYQRNHDANACSIYGGPYAHDITAVFPNFDADENSADSYDFECTDEAILTALEAGTKTFFRLGQTIEHQIKKHGTLPPKDFEKWARICEHIIRHYNEGWANGFQLDIEYWEIWNEPDLRADDAEHKTTWGGTQAQFFDFYEVAAKHLKKCFPKLKIGGPSLATLTVEWADDFLREMQKRSVPIDFLSWHIYCIKPSNMIGLADKLQSFLDKYGYGNAESILTEWNYIADWGAEYVKSIKDLNSIKGAVFTAACMAAAQHSPIDMLMYYDTRPSIFNGVFDFYSLEPKKAYYPLMWYGKFYDMTAEILCESKCEDIYTLCGTDKDEKALALITYYTDEKNMPEKQVKVDFGRNGEYEVYLLDETHDGELIEKTNDLSFTMNANSCILIKEI